MFLKRRRGRSRKDWIQHDCMTLSPLALALPVLFGFLGSYSRCPCVVAEGHSKGKTGISISDVLTAIVFFSSSPKPLTTHPSAFTERNMSPSQVTDQTIFPGGMGRGEWR